MNLFRCFGLGSNRIIADGNTVTGTVTKQSICWWFKVNTKPFRKHAWDGAVFPHMITFSYTIDGKEYIGNRFIHWNLRCPVVGEHITVYYNRYDPRKYVVIL